MVTPDEVVELVADCPTLFHMAQGGSWESIRKHGLLSTSALLDLFGLSSTDRFNIESMRRPESVVLKSDTLGRIVIRDNKPMDDKGLARALDDTITPQEWYELLNGRVFFWLTKDRLVRLLTAGSYAEDEHDVLELDTASLIADYYDRIELCPMNSGATKPIPHPRGKSSFRKIEEYPYADWRRKRRRGERVVELTVPHGVVSIEKYVRKVLRMKGNEEVSTIFQR